MNTYLPLIIKNSDNQGKILHITDTHLFAKDEGTLLGVKTNISFHGVIDEIETQVDDIDLIVATGDFVQDGTDEAYLHFVQGVKRLAKPCVWVPGNHDNYHNMKHIFTHHNIPEQKVILLGEQWLIIMLNSQVEGQAYGLLAQSELDFLTAVLAQYPKRYAMIFLHHHPVMSGCHWLDQHCLKNSQQFGEVIKTHATIQAIGWGHIHQNLDTTWHHCQVFSTPSTCVQFKPLSNDFNVSNESSPGFRVIELGQKGTFNSKVHHLNNLLFQPDVSQTGY